MMDPHRTVELPQDREARTDALISREWLVTNGLGGYSSNTLPNVPTRRYHGVLVAALPNPQGRTVMLTELSERVRLEDGTIATLTGEERTGGVLTLPAVQHLIAFHLELGMPVWRFQVGDAVLEKRAWMPYHQNTVYLNYRLVEAGGSVRLNLRPALNFRPVEDPVSTPLREPYVLSALDDRLEIAGERSVPPLRLRLDGARSAFTVEPRALEERLYRVEARRGYEDTGDLWSPGYYRMDLRRGDEVTLVASTEPWSTMLALAPAAALAAELERRRRLLGLAPAPLRTGTAAELTLAADAFVVTPAYRAEDVAQRRAAGDELRSIIAGYHWFTDWGRDTMIALEGLTLCTGRHREAGEILRTFAQYMRDGLIPNMFPNGSSDGLYNTADATLWFFHAVDRYVETTRDRATLRRLLPTLRAIAEHHLRGTQFGIRIDQDGLLTQGADGLQLTWMDAKVDGWVVTPRRGKAVELNALWYNALRLLEGWLDADGDAAAARQYGQHAAGTYAAFNRRFWFDRGGYLYDVVDGENGDDPALRPNQVMAISLPYAVLEPDRWENVLSTVTEHLLTPFGLRSLAPGHADYRPNYHGDLRTRDAAYHQGTVWPWLIGPFVDAWLRVYPNDLDGARRHLDGLMAHLGDFGVGSVAEICDAEAPFTPRGCIAQAWSVAELLRCWVRVRAAGAPPSATLRPAHRTGSVGRDDAYGVDARRRARGQVAGEQRDEQQDRDDRAEHEGVA
jgi:predicted glycogen debranching enzyme